MKLKTFFISLTITTFVLTATLLLVSPFLVTFGPTPLFNKIMAIFYDFPIENKDFSTNMFFLILIINSLFWSIIGHIIFYSLAIAFTQKKNNVEKKDMKKNKTIFDAIYTDSEIDVLHFLKIGINVNTINEYKRTPLIEATIEKNLALVKLLIKNGADVNISDVNDWTALHFAAQEYDLGLCKYLVENGANINAKDNYGNTPLFRAEYESNEDTGIQCYLIKNGADESIKNNHGVSSVNLRETMGRKPYSLVEKVLHKE